MRGFESATGRPVWSYSYRDNTAGPPGHVPGAAVLGFGYYVDFLDLERGTQALPPFRTGPDPFGSPTLVGKTLYVGNRDGGLSAYAYPSRRLKWRFELPERHGQSPSHFIHTGERIYLSTREGVYCLEQHAGKSGAAPEGTCIRAPSYN